MPDWSFPAPALTAVWWRPWSCPAVTSHLGAQFHPEFKSRPNRAHPLFKGFIAAALKFRIHAQRGMMHV